MNTMYPMNQNFAKLSLLALYYRLFSVNRAFVKWIWAIGIIQMCWFMAMFWIRWFMCTPVAKVWEPTLPGHCIDSNVLLVAGEAVNSPIDFVMVALAVYMVRSLKVSHAARWKLSSTFYPRLELGTRPLTLDPRSPLFPRRPCCESLENIY